MHAQKHTKPECLPTGGKFSPYCGRFKIIYNKKNSQILEQLNSRVNKLRFVMRTMSDIRVETMFYHVQTYQNAKVRKKLERKGVEFVSLQEYKEWRESEAEWQKAQKLYENELKELQNEFEQWKQEQSGNKKNGSETNVNGELITNVRSNSNPLACMNNSTMNNTNIVSQTDNLVQQVSMDFENQETVNKLDDNSEDLLTIDEQLQINDIQDYDKTSSFLPPAKKFKLCSDRV